MPDARDRARLEVIDHAGASRPSASSTPPPATSPSRVEGEPGVIAMTPTSLAYDALEPADICLVTHGAASSSTAGARRRASCRCTRSSTRAAPRSGRSSTRTPRRR